MSNLLKLFNSMSGMQKSFLTEDSKEDIKKLSDKVATKTLTSTMGKSRTPGQLSYDLIAKYDADKERFEAFKKELENKVKTLQNNVDNLEKQKAKLIRAFDTATAKKDNITAKSLEKRLKKVQSLLISASRKLRLAETDKAEDLEKAERKLKAAEAKLSGKTRGERAITKKGLEGINPLVVPIKTEDKIGPGQLTFSQMSSVAHMGGYGEENKDLIDFDTAITSLNRAIGFIFPDFLSKIGKKTAALKE